MNMIGSISIQTDRSRCIRHRYNKSTCSRCRDACHLQAVTLENGLSISDKMCTGCMLCVSACTSEALTIEGYNIKQTLSELRGADNPVIACSRKEDMLAHVSGPCLGFLSKEYLASLPIILGKSIQLNLTQCSVCENSHIIDVLIQNLAEVDGVVPVESAEELDYQDICTSRRDFFRMLRGGSLRAVQEFASFANQDESQSSYSSKALPVKRQLLNMALEACSDAQKTRLEALYIRMYVDEACNGCMACAAMCPTGALSKSSGALQFDTLLCTGCALCEEFCVQRAILIEHGLSVAEREGGTIMYEALAQ